MTPDEDRIEGGKCDMAYDDHVARVTDLLYQEQSIPASDLTPERIAHMGAMGWNTQDLEAAKAIAQPMRLCRMCGKHCPDGSMRGHICWECDFMFGNVMDEKLKRER